MILKKDNFWLGFIIGLIAPFGGFIIYRYIKLSPLGYFEALQYIILDPSHRLLTIAMSLCLLANAVLFTLYVNAHIDKTARGIFAATCIYGAIILVIKTIY